MATAATALAATVFRSSDTWSGRGRDVAKADRWTAASVTRKALDALTGPPDGRHAEVTRCSPGWASPGTERLPTPTDPVLSGLSVPMRTPSKKK